MPDVPTYKVEIDWDHDGQFENAYCDITRDVSDVRITRGKASLTHSPEVGTCEVTLHNDDNKYTPRSPDSPLYGLMHPNRQLRVSIIYEGATYWHFTGYIVLIQPRGELESRYCYIRVVDLADWMDRVLISTPLYANQTVDQLAALILDQLPPRETSGFWFTFDSDVAGFDRGILYAGAWALVLRSLDAIEERIPYAWWDKASALQSLLDLATIVGGACYIDGSGIFRLESRYHLLSGDHTSIKDFPGASFIETVEAELSPDDVVNIVEITVAPRELGAAETVIAEWNEVPKHLPPHSTLEVELSYGDPATNVITPEPTTDYLGNSEENGFGDDLTASLDFSFSTFAARGVCTFGNSTDGGIWLTLLQVRGQPITALEESIVRIQDPTSRADYSDRSWEHSNPLMQERPVAERLAVQKILLSSKPCFTPTVRAFSADVVADIPWVPIIERDLGDRVSVAFPNLGIPAASFNIAGVVESITALGHNVGANAEEGVTHEIEYFLEEALEIIWFTFDDVSLGFDRGLLPF